MRIPSRREAALGAAAATLGATAAPAPRRVVSLNPCLDAILVQVADPAQIAAVSHYSHDPSSSSIGAAARGLPFTYGDTEEVLALRPDLVLTARYASPAARAALERLHVRTALFGVPASVEESLAQVTAVAALVGRPERGAALVARIRAALAAAAPPPGARRPSALVFQSGGLVTGPGTMTDEMLRRTGFANAAAKYGLTHTGAVPLERLVADPPDVLLAGQARPGAPTWADRVLSHPALARVAGRMRREALPQRLTYCGGPVLIELAQTLARARRDALGSRR